MVEEVWSLSGTLSVLAPPPRSRSARPPCGGRGRTTAGDEGQVADGDEPAHRGRAPLRGARPCCPRYRSRAEGARAPSPGKGVARALEPGLETQDCRTNARDFHSPQQNITYADVNGNIGFLAPGLIPIRRGHLHERSGTMPRPGWDASYDWQGFVPFEELPRVYNPPGGAIVTANQQIVSDHYPHHLTFEWAGGYRAQRIMEKLAEPGRHDVESFRALQQDRVSLFARALLPRLRRVTASTSPSRRSVRHTSRTPGAACGWFRAERSAMRSAHPEARPESSNSFGIRVKGFASMTGGAVTSMGHSPCRSGVGTIRVCAGARRSDGSLGKTREVFSQCQT